MTPHLPKAPTDTSGPNASPPTDAVPRLGASAAVARVGRIVPTLLVLAALGGLAACGHHTGWKVPRFSALVGHGPAPEQAWCEEHNVPEAECVECNPGLMPRGKESPYCKKHGVPECPLDHPEIAQVQGRPRFPRYDVLAALALRDRPENNSKCKLHQRRIQFASAAAAEKAGVDVDVVGEAPMEEFVAANGEVSYDQTRVARLSSRLPGTVWRVDKQLGDPVREDEVLALVDAAEVGKAKAEFLQAYAQLELRRKTYEGLSQAAATGAVPDRQVREAETTLSEARIRLRAVRQALVNLGLPVNGDDLKGLPEDRLAARVQFLGLPDSLAGRLDPERTTANLLPVTAPLDGVVVAREVGAREVVDSTRVLFVVADPRRMWLTLNVRAEDARRVKPGQPVRFRPDGDPAEVGGKVAWISTAVDEKTRTVKVRADLENPDGRLRAHAFGPGRVVLRSEPYAVVVPKEAVHWEGDCHVVFVRDKDYLKEGAPKVFHVRKVRPGARDEKYVEILAGVLPGEVVATKGSAVLQAELLRGQLGEG
jgi:cobalt-zinc-cadmium efflux system membrane fusion protein